MLGSVSNQNEDKNPKTDYKLVWDESLETLRLDIAPAVFSAYLSRLQFISFDEESSELHLEAPSNLVSRHIEENYTARISSIFSKKLSRSNIKLKLSTSLETNSNPAYIVVKKIAPAASVVANSNIAATDPSDQIFCGQRPNPKYTFENFVVGNSNQFCHAAAMQVAEKPGETYNPLFIYGGVGLGKTHLMHAIGNAVLQRKPEARILYLSSETFTNVLIQSLRQGKMEEFKDRMRNIEVLLIDDIQFMRGKETTQEEFFHTFNALYSAKHQIVITSDKNPSEIPAIEERLRTRFAWGLTADMQAPDFETRVAILRENAEREGFVIPEDVAHFVADNFASNVRELEGALTRLHAVSSLQKIPMSLELANSALKSLLQPKVTNISVDEIKKAVSTHFSVKISDIISKRRHKNIAFPRHVAMYLCRKHTTYSYPEIGHCFGGRDHSSVIHAANVVSNKVKSDPEIKAMVEQLEKRLFWN